METYTSGVKRRMKINKYKKPIWNKIKEQRFLYLMILPAFIWVILFCYAPMYGLYMAFINYVPDGRPFFTSFFSSEFVGFRWFSYFVNSGDFLIIMRNTLCTSLLTLVVSFPAPIILAIAINEVHNLIFKKVVQTVSYLPYFISWVIAANIFLSMLSSEGFVNQFLLKLNLIQDKILFFQEPKYFWWIMAISSTWKGMGYGSVIYLAGIAGISQELYEASKVDGANRWHQIIHITLPCLKPTIIILLILSMGGILNAGFDQQFLMSNQMVMSHADVIDTYTYRYGLQNFMFSYGAAVGLFKSVVSFILVVTVNNIAKKLNDQALF